MERVILPDAVTKGDNSWPFARFGVQSSGQHDLGEKFMDNVGSKCCWLYVSNFDKAAAPISDLTKTLKRLK